MSEKKLLKAEIRLLKKEISSWKTENYRILRVLTEGQAELGWAKEDKEDIINRIAQIILYIAERADREMWDEDTGKYDLCEDFARRLYDILLHYAPDDVIEEVVAKLPQGWEKGVDNDDNYR